MIFNYSDLQKLELISNSTEDYFAGIMKKSLVVARFNNHDMSIFLPEMSFDRQILRHFAYCKQCKLEIDIEHFKSDTFEKVYVISDLAQINDSCYIVK